MTGITSRDIESVIPLVCRIVRRDFPKINLPTVDHDDLAQAGMVAVMLAARRYDPERGVPWRLFAARRAYGAMLDHIRDQRLGRRRAHEWQTVSLDAIEDGESLIEQAALREYDDDTSHHDPSVLPMLHAAIDRLPTQQRIVMRLYAMPEMTQQKIARMLGVTAPAVSQTLTRASRNLRKHPEIKALLNG